MGAPTSLDFAPAFEDLFRPAPYKIFYGGRGAAKSWAVARYLLIRAASEKTRILCVREFQSAIKDSVHKLLADQIEAMGLQRWFDVTREAIRSSVGSEFLFKGLKINLAEVKSTEGINITWAEEAQVISAMSWQTLLPTIERTKGAELILTFNPDQEADPTYQNFVVKALPGSIVRKVGWQDNPWFPEGLDRQRRHMLATDPEAYEWIWEGNTRQISDAVIFKTRVSVETFETPENARLYFGADWGFADDPAVLIRCWIDGPESNQTLYIDHEAFGFHVELDNLAVDVFDQVPGSRRWPIKADSAQPAQISYMHRQGFQIDGADKWPGSVEDGINYLKSFKRIAVHERCKNIAQEFRLYSYKVDKQTGKVNPTTGQMQADILPVVVDKHNHGVDSLRYALGQFIQRGGGMVVSAGFAKAFASGTRRR